MPLFFSLILPLLFCCIEAAFAQTNACEQIESLLPEISSLRNISFKTKPECEVLSKDKFLKKKRELYAQELSPERLKWEAVYHKALGLIPEDYEYERCVLEGASEDVVAFYDQSSKAIYIPEGTPPEPDVLVHELVHALQDQEFKLSRLENIARQSTDASMAVSSIVEGDAVLVQKLFLSTKKKKYLAQSTEQLSQPSPCYPPQLLLEQYEFPYYFGELFALKLYKAAGNFKKINDVLHAPPTTSHEIIHNQINSTDTFEKELEPVLLPRIFSEKIFTPEFTDILGQFTIRLILSQSIKQSSAIRAAKGWKSDRLTVYKDRSQKRAIVAWHTVWATLEDSEEFYQSMKTIIEGRFGLSINDEAHISMGTFENEPTFLLRNRGRVIEIFLVQAL